MPPPGPKVDRILSFEPIIRMVRSEATILSTIAPIGLPGGDLAGRDACRFVAASVIFRFTLTRVIGACGGRIPSRDQDKGLLEEASSIISFLPERVASI